MTELTPTERLHLALMLTLTFTTGISVSWRSSEWFEDRSATPMLRR